MFLTNEPFDSQAHEKRFIRFIEQVCEDAVIKALKSKPVLEVVAPYAYDYKSVPRKVLNDVIKPLLSDVLRLTFTANSKLLTKMTKGVNDVKGAKIKHDANKAALRKELSEIRSVAREGLSKELKVARFKLRHLRQEAERLERSNAIRLTPEGQQRLPLAVQLARARARLRSLHVATEGEVKKLVKVAGYSADLNHKLYGVIPPPTHDPVINNMPTSIPDASGIYFLWNGDSIEYVGQSIQLSKRLTLGSHHILKPHHKISYLLIERVEIDWAEAWFIGVCRPISNREGKRHREQAGLPTPRVATVYEAA